MKSKNTPIDKYFRQITRIRIYQSRRRAIEKFARKIVPIFNDNRYFWGYPSHIPKEKEIFEAAVFLYKTMLFDNADNLSCGRICIEAYPKYYRLFLETNSDIYVYLSRHRKKT